ncbi:MAG: hypothetical protein ACI8ZM_001904 [Crocinitomix sp.]|jgi:hypothetical protein
MNQKNLKKYIYILLGLLVTAFCIIGALGNGDFKVFLEAAKLVAAGENPYNKWLFVSEGVYCLYFYSPLWAVILSPFSFLPNFIPNFIWLAANIFFLYRILTLLKNYVDINTISKKQLRWIILLCSIMSLRFILYNFGMIQMTLFLLWGGLESIRLMSEKKVTLGAILLALIINIKILPIVIIPYLLYRKHYRGLIYTLIFSFVFILLPSLYTGWTENLFLLTEWWGVINPGNTEHLIESELGPHSLTALIPSLLTETSGELSITRNFMNLSEAVVIQILNITRLLLIVFSLYFLRWSPFVIAKSKLFQLRELAYIFLLIPLIFPHQQKYAFALTIPALFYLCHFVVINFSLRKKVMKGTRWYLLIVLMSFSFMLMTLSSDGVIGRELSNISQHFKTITWGTMLLIFALALAQPQITKKTKQLQLAKPKQD